MAKSCIALKYIHANKQKCKNSVSHFEILGIFNFNYFNDSNYWMVLVHLRTLLHFGKLADDDVL